MKERSRQEANRVLNYQGCGDPVAWSRLKPGETVLDLGCGFGRDALLAARQVGDSGLVYGLDSSGEALAAANLAKARDRVGNVHFLQGDIVAIPLPSSCVDVVISNCVLCLSGNRRQVFAEIIRVLKPGGRIALADIAATRLLPPAVLKELSVVFGKLSPIVGLAEYAAQLTEAGFSSVAVQPVHLYDIAHPRLNRLVFLLPQAKLDSLRGALVSVCVVGLKAPV